MGKDKRHFKGANKSQGKTDRKAKAEAWAKTTGGHPNRNSWDNMIMENERFTAFYKAMNFIKDGEEWDSFIDHLKAPLPACFRINSDYSFSSQLERELQGYAGQTISLEDGTTVDPVQQLHWYPGGHAYKLGSDRRSIRKMQGLDGLHKWMVQNTEKGNITRQEAVSMVPPLALDVQPHHKCLDMCAAPGSKTSQLLEIVNKSLGAEVEGLVVANDASTDRAYMLVHQCRRINSPLLVITTHKGQMLPKIRNMEVPDTTVGSSEYYMKNGYFDRVLADVPCSGDGTLRKNPAIWEKWNVGSSISLHSLQISIATRGIQLTKVGGLLVYSTCSMSPYEDEAAVAELLRQSAGTLELVDCRQFLPKFQCRPGLSTWYVCDDKNASKRAQKQRAYKEAKAKEFAETLKKETDDAAADADADANARVDVQGSDADVKEEAATSTANEVPYVRITTHPDPKMQACLDLGFDLFLDYDSVPQGQKQKYKSSLFPPTAEEAKWMHLERCMRCVPHDEDTGGFFVATLRKVSAVTTTPVVAATVVTSMAVEEESVEHSAKRAATGENRDAIATAESATQGSSAASAASASAAGAGAVVVAPAVTKGFVDYTGWEEDAYKCAKAFYGLNEEALPLSAFYTRQDHSTGLKHQQQSAAQGKPKGVFYFPVPTRELLAASELKVVAAGMKVFERKKDLNPNGPGPAGHYRLVQEGVSILAPYMTKRIINITAQDISNVLAGGLVSYSTLAPQTVATLSSIDRGPVVCVYKYNPDDAVVKEEGEGKSASAMTSTAASSAIGVGGLVVPLSRDANPSPLCIICSVNGGASKAMNVLCGKTEADSLRHQLHSMGVLREKIYSITEKVNAAAAAASAVVTTTADVTATDVKEGGGEATATVAEHVSHE